MRTPLGAILAPPPLSGDLYCTLSRTSAGELTNATPPVRDATNKQTNKQTPAPQELNSTASTAWIRPRFAYNC